MLVKLLGADTVGDIGASGLAGNWGTVPAPGEVIPDGKLDLASLIIEPIWDFTIAAINILKVGIVGDEIAKLGGVNDGGV